MGAVIDLTFFMVFFMADNLYTQADDEQQISKIDKILLAQQRAFQEKPYPSVHSRIQDLSKLKTSILAYQESLVQALTQDFGCRSAGDSNMADILPTVMAINYAIKHVKKWMKYSKRHVGILFQPAQAYVMYQPLGVVGIITPWNYPVFLALGPLTTAIAAGNRAMIKMSEFTPATNQVLEALLTDIFPSSQVTIITGGVSVASYFSEQAFDHLLFTGSTQVGKQVMSAAAKNLTPVTLELGGKSPTVIDDDINMNEAVSRFILAKTINSGQTCVAPDYILCPHARISQLKKAIAERFVKMYPSIANNSDCTAIINQAQLQRLQHYLEDAKSQGAELFTLSRDDLQACYLQQKMPLTLITNVKEDMLIMQEEIFGPILPIIGYQHIEEAIDYINARPRPLALYLCSHNRRLQQTILYATHAGGVCFNDAAMQVVQEDIPFGGIGPSGMGQYHGHEGFLTFSKAKPVFKKGKFTTAVSAFPPYGNFIHRLIYKFFLAKKL